MEEVVAGIAGVVLTLAGFWVFHVLRERRPTLGGDPRQERFSSQGTARIPIEYEDRPGRNLPTEATSLNGSFTLRIENRGIGASSQVPALLGDPSTFLGLSARGPSW